MTSRFQDKFDRDDGELGSNYTIPCGGAAIFDEVVLPVNIEEVQSGQSPILEGTTDQKAQVLYTGATLDFNDYAVRAVWSRLAESYATEDGTQNDPSFTILARMTKDPVLLDLGTEEDPACYDQGYGLRVTTPKDGSAPVLKLVKFVPKAIAPGVDPSTSAEVDEAIVMASVTLTGNNLNTDPGWDGTGDIPYQGFVQDMRLRVRRADDMVVLDAYLNDRNRNTPILSYTDYTHPMWGIIGVPGFEFISAAQNDQGAGNSPFELDALPLMLCHLFEAETVKDTAPARTSHPSNRWTYGRIAERAILLVEKQGDAKYSASLNGQTKRTIYLDFVYEAEREILSMVGYWWFLYRTGRKVYLKNNEAITELPEDCGEILAVTPGNWDAPPLSRVEDAQWGRVLAGTKSTIGGQPRIYRPVTPEVNDRPSIELWPVPSPSDAPNNTEESDTLFIEVDYYARHIEPYDPDTQVPFIPQDHADVLIYKAAALALALDTDPQNIQVMDGMAERKLIRLRRKNERKVGDYRTTMRYEGHVMNRDRHSLVPQTRLTSLGHRIP